MSESVEVVIDGSALVVEKGGSLKEAIALLHLEKKPVLAGVDGEVVGLGFRLEKNGRAHLIYSDSDEGIDILRHSASHLMAQAVIELFPGTQVGIGPAVENGFYYDFLRETPFTPQDLETVEKKMHELADQNLPIQKIIQDKPKAAERFKNLGQSLKVELIEEKGGEKVSCYAQGGFIDFCLGPHVPSTGYIKHFKLLSVSGAYWKGDERGQQLQRIYGTVFYEKKQLADYLRLLEEAKERDHRRLGAELDLFSSCDDLGGGLILWHPKGARVRAVIEQHWRERHWAGGYDILFTPHIGRASLWQTSGHLDFYKDSMYSPMNIDEQDYYIKPMNCPFHIQIYKTRLRSYRDLPLRWAELGTVYRYERSGVLHGLLRVRGFTQDDAHIICTPQQIDDEILRVLDFSLSILADFGFTDNKIELSVRDPQNLAKYAGSEEMWRQAEASLVRALEARKLPYKRMEGEAVFYGPKIDIKIKDALGRHWQCTTIQFDFNMSEKFQMEFIGEDNQAHRPYMVHRALLGSLERFFGILIEHYKGNFPLWLAPVQAIVLPISERHESYAVSLEKLLKESGLRAQGDVRREKVGYKIRDAENQKIPVILVVGDRETANGTASLRVHTQGDKGEVVVAEFIAKLKNLNDNRALELNF
ncbi:MAG: threonine--tRNA ligase [Candidatus Aminicenantes bacterium RBG_16_63_16]|nr:MAG: threonine--tRNA ligase [Candidatus Aminicenantes bacterium RBG_16_63_16]